MKIGMEEYDVPIIIALIISIILVLIIYGLLYYLGRRQTNTITTLDERKQEILALPVADKLFKIKNKNVSGSTRRLYEKEQANWQTVKQYNIPEIEAALVAAQSETDKFSLVKARQTTDKAESLLDETEKTIQKINEALTEILKREGENEAFHEKTYQRYADIRKQLLAHGYAYGEAIEVLEKHLSYLELDFTKYNALMNDGDFIGANDELKQINADIDELEQMMQLIPDMLKQITEEYAEQLEDIQQGYQRMRQEAYQFPKAIHIDAEIEKVEKDIQSAYNAVITADLSEGENLMKASEVQIDHTYQLMESELSAKQYIDQNRGTMQRKLDQIHQSNRYAQLEIDRVSQSYLLHENESGKMKDYADEIAQEHHKIDRVNEQEAAHTIAYTDMQKAYQNTYELLNKIEKGQSHIVASLSNLKQREREARDEVYGFDLDLRNMQRQIEQYHLPGLDDAYLDEFFATEDLIDDLSHKLTRVKLDIEAIEKMMQEIAQRVERLDIATEKILDEAILTENTIQYANRYRSDSAEINRAIEEAGILFNEKFDYAGAHQHIARALDRIEAGASQRVISLYHADKAKGHY
ncbi:MAG: septation ring formation regulator EzrA [Aerococcus sp.]|nr:septation ring formation regulator EzrA [Aerococcus sp.]